MNPLTRRSVLAGVAALSTAGCLGGSDDGAEGTTATTRTRRTPTTERAARTTEGTTRETTAEETTAHVDFWREASKEPDPGHSVTLRNDAAEPRSVRVRVVREATDETVFDEARDLAAGEVAQVYDLRRADPDGIESFRVCAEFAPPAADTTRETSVGSVTSAGSATSAESATTAADSATHRCVTLKTNACYGNATVIVSEDGSLGIVHSIC